MGEEFGLNCGLNCTWVDEEKTNKEKTKQRETNFKKKAKQGEE